MSDETTPVSEFSPGEVVTSPADPRLTARLPRAAGEPDTVYAKRLAAAGIALVVTSEEMQHGPTYKAVKARAIAAGKPLVHPLTDAEAAMLPPERPELDYRSFRDALRKYEREGSIGPRPDPRSFIRPAA
jgi:hypothetical protein